MNVQQNFNKPVLEILILSYCSLFHNGSQTRELKYHLERVLSPRTQSLGVYKKAFLNV